MTRDGAAAKVALAVRAQSIAAEPRRVRAVQLVARAVACVALAACGHGASARPHVSPFQTSCVPTGTSLAISAHNVRYDRTCMAVPANVPFTITFVNRDPGIRHNVAIFAGSRMYSQNAPTLFRGAVITGPATVTYQVPPLPPGTSYTFHCDVHADEMVGVFLVIGANPSS
jgi:plastocyanin